MTPTENESTYAIVPAAGHGIRLGLETPKQFLTLHRIPILLRTLESLLPLDFIHGLVVAAPPEWLEETRGMVEDMGRGENKPVKVVPGGEQRYHSIEAALRDVPTTCRWILIHDAVRPLASARLHRRTWSAAKETGAAVCACPPVDTIKRVSHGYVAETLDRGSLRLVQTPQVFRSDILRSAYESLDGSTMTPTDDASLVEALGHRVVVVMGERSNIKITTREDLLWAEMFLHVEAGR